MAHNSFSRGWRHTNLTRKTAKGRCWMKAVCRRAIRRFAKMAIYLSDDFDNMVDVAPPYFTDWNIN